MIVESQKSKVERAGKKYKVRDLGQIFWSGQNRSQVGVKWFRIHLFDRDASIIFYREHSCMVKQSES